MDEWEFEDLSEYIPLGAACANGNVCPNASVQDCNQTGGEYTGHSAKWTTQVQVTMGGDVKG